MTTKYDYSLFGQDIRDRFEEIEDLLEAGDPMALGAANVLHGDIQARSTSSEAERAAKVEGMKIAKDLIDRAKRGDPS